MSDTHQPIRFRVSDGGDLMTRVSADRAGLSGYLTRRDWRLDLDQEVRREGDLYFAPGSDNAVDPFPAYPSTSSPITLTFTARRANGDTAFICGTASTIYRYFRYGDGLVVESAYVASDYAQDLSGVWLTIGTGYSTSGHRWEAENIGGTVVFNNGVDPLLRYRLEEFAIRPIYELREQGIAYVDTIAEHQGALLLFGVGAIRDDILATVMNSGAAYGTVTDPGMVNHIAYRSMWSPPGLADRFGSSVDGTIALHSVNLTLKYPMASLSAGDSIRVVGAGTDGGNLVTTIMSISGTAVVLADYAQTAVTDALVSKADVDSLNVGAYDLQDDGSAILRGVSFQEQIVVFKAGGHVYVGGYTGTLGNAYAYKRVHVSDDSNGVEAPYFRWTICSPDGRYLLYAGRKNFLQFDLVNLRPVPHQKFLLCDDLFYKSVTSADVDRVFAFNNTLTNEVWFCYPSSTADKGLCYDYRFDRISTIGESYTAGVTTQRPTSTGIGEKWVVLGRSDSSLVQYYLTDSGVAGWTRRGGTYSSVLQFGRGDFNDTFNEKSMVSYLVLLSSESPDATITAEIYGSTNPGGSVSLLDTFTFTSPQTRNVAFTHYVFHLLQDKITASGTTNVCLTERVFNVDIVGSRSVVRT